MTSPGISPPSCTTRGAASRHARPRGRCTTCHELGWAGGGAHEGVVSADGAAELARIARHVAERPPRGRLVGGLARQEVERDARVARRGRGRRGGGPLCEGGRGNSHLKGRHGADVGDADAARRGGGAGVCAVARLVSHACVGSTARYGRFCWAPRGNSTHVRVPVYTRARRGPAPAKKKARGSGAGLEAGAPRKKSSGPRLLTPPSKGPSRIAR